MCFPQKEIQNRGIWNENIVHMSLTPLLHKWETLLICHGISLLCLDNNRIFSGIERHSATTNQSPLATVMDLHTVSAEEEEHRILHSSIVT